MKFTQESFLFSSMKKRLIRIALIGFILLNVMAVFHGYTLTHFSNDTGPKTKLAKLSTSQKVATLFFGASNPRPIAVDQPQGIFTEVNFPGGEGVLGGWYRGVDTAKGNVPFFHGYAGEKSSMLERASLIRKMGYNTLLIDFRGSGSSTGNRTTVGFEEAEDVKTTWDYLRNKNPQPTYLLGTSMGAAAIMKAVDTYQLPAKGIILECPFGSMLQTTKNRFEALGVPSFPSAQVLVFWGGIQNGFWAFDHNPSAYAKGIEVPTLLIFGEKDKRVKRSEIDAIFENLAGEKRLLSMPDAGHANYLAVDKANWEEEVRGFLGKEFPGTSALR